jgi:CPA2 family monovalent cation:H+ antiporter-2
LALGPSGFGLGADQPGIHLMSEAGVVLLMFSLGIEFSLSELRNLRRTALRGGVVQMVLAAAGLSGVAALFGLGWKEAVLLGVIGSMSSTAVVLRSFQEGPGTSAPAARIAVGVAIFQDLFAIALMVVLPSLLAGGNGGWVQGLAGAVARGAGFLVAGWALSRYVVPRILAWVSATKSRELFTLAVVALCAGIAWLGHGLGLSLALGAFAAGLIVSETVYSHRILADVVPFRDVFLAVFFVGVGMMVDVRVLAAEWVGLLGAVALVMLWKGLAGFAGGVAAGFTARPSIAAGLGLSQVGEFSFVLLAAAADLGGIAAPWTDRVIACGVLSMAATPLAMRLAGPLANWCDARGILRVRSHPSAESTPSRLRGLQSHGVVCGYGVIGRSLNEALRKMGVETLVVELNSRTVEQLVKQGQPCLFADVAHPETHLLAGLERARVFAVTIPHFEATRAAVKTARELNPSLFIVCRARYPTQVAPLRESGADVVINEEVETGFGMIRRALAQYDVGDEAIDEIERQARADLGV